MNNNHFTLRIQILWALLCIAWNAYGLWLVSNDQKPFAPTASLIAAILCLVFAVLFWIFYQKKLKWPYIILSLISAIFAAYAVYGGFSQDPSLWSSESWRWAGIILNGMGALAGLAAVKGALKWV
jgi:hypothetical protein